MGPSMNAQHEAIFRKAMVSGKPQAILGVARAFYDMGDIEKAHLLHNRAVTMTWIGGINVSFGAMARGTPIPGTNGAVIPPGRYWIDLIGDKREKFKEWFAMKPEVTIEVIEHPDTNRDFAIFIVPTFANNYGMPGVLFPTQDLGFPTIADASTHTSADTVQRPPPMTYTEATQEVGTMAGKAIGAGIKGASTGISAGLGISPTMLWLGAGTFALIALKLLI